MKFSVKTMLINYLDDIVKIFENLESVYSYVFIKLEFTN